MDNNAFGRRFIDESSESLFENKFLYTEPLLRELYKNMLKWDKRRKVNSIFIYILLGANIVMNIIFVLIGNYDLLNLLIISMILLAVVVVFRALEPIILSKQVMRGYSKRYGEDMDVRMTFDEDYMTLYDVSMGASMRKALPYSSIVSVHESEHFIVLRMDKRQVMPILKDGFTKGTLDEFRVFIMRKIKEVESESYDMNASSFKKGDAEASANNAAEDTEQPETGNNEDATVADKNDQVK